MAHAGGKGKAPSTPIVTDRRKNKTILWDAVSPKIVELVNYAYQLTNQCLPPQSDIFYQNAKGEAGTQKGPNLLHFLELVKAILLQQRDFIMLLWNATLPLDARHQQAKDIVLSFVEWMQPQMSLLSHRMEKEGQGTRVDPASFSTALRFFAPRYNARLMEQGSAIRFEVEGTHSNVECDADMRVMNDAALLCLVEAKVQLPQEKGAVSFDPGIAQRWLGQVTAQANISTAPVITIILDGGADGAVERLASFYRPGYHPTQTGLKWALLCCVAVDYPPSIPQTKLQLEYEQFVDARKVSDDAQRKQNKLKSNAKSDKKRKANAS